MKTKTRLVVVPMTSIATLVTTRWQHQDYSDDDIIRCGSSEDDFDSDSSRN